MKTLIVYHSFHHGNTAKIAKVLADESKRGSGLEMTHFPSILVCC